MGTERDEDSCPFLSFQKLEHKKKAAKHLKNVCCFYNKTHIKRTEKGHKRKGQKNWLVMLSEVWARKNAKEYLTKCAKYVTIYRKRDHVP